MLALCDKCEKTFEAQVIEQEATVEPLGKITRRLFYCPQCDAEYNVGFFNDNVYALIAENRALVKINDKPARKQFNQNLRKIQNLSAQMNSAWNRNQVTHGQPDTDIG